MGEEVGAKENKDDLRYEHNLKKENERSHSLIYAKSRSSSTKNQLQLAKKLRDVLQEREGTSLNYLGLSGTTWDYMGLFGNI